MPEAAVHEDGHLRSPEEDVRPSPPIEVESDIHSVAKPAAVEQATEREFRRGVPPALPLHPLPDFVGSGTR